MKKFICSFIFLFVFTGIVSYGAFGATGWHVVSWKKQYLYPNGQSDNNTYLKYYFSDEGSYDAINAYYTSGGDRTVARAETKDGGGQLVYGKWASSSSSYPNTSTAKQGAQRGNDYARWGVKK